MTSVGSRAFSSTIEIIGQDMTMCLPHSPPWLESVAVPKSLPAKSTNRFIWYCDRYIKQHLSTWTLHLLMLSCSFRLSLMRALITYTVAFSTWLGAVIGIAHGHKPLACVGWQLAVTQILQHNQIWTTGQSGNTTRVQRHTTGTMDYCLHWDWSNP